MPRLSPRPAKRPAARRALWLAAALLPSACLLHCPSLPARLFCAGPGHGPHRGHWGLGLDAVRRFPLATGPRPRDGLFGARVLPRVPRRGSRLDVFADDRGAEQGASDSSLGRLAATLVGMVLLVSFAVQSPLAARAADSDSSSKQRMAAVAPCLLSKCQLPLAKCVLNPSCAANLTCIIGCTGAADEKACQIKCGDNFENDVVDEFNACAVSSKRCVPQRPDLGPLPAEWNWTPLRGRYPVPPAKSISQDFDVSKMSGRWYITAGLNPLFDTFNCQVHFFEGMAPKGDQPGKLVGKINWRITEPDGEYLTRNTVQTFVQTAPGILENHGNEYLHYQDDWYVLDHSDEDNPDLGFVLIYYRGQNDAWSGYGGGTLYTRAPRINPDILDRVCEACQKANVPFYRFWKLTDNSCPIVTDPVKLRAQYAEKLIEQGELSVEEQLTYAARSAYSKASADEREVVMGAQKIEKMTESFVKEQARDLAKAEKAVEKEVASDLYQVGDKLERDLGRVGTEIAKDEQLIENPIRKFLGSIFQFLR